MHVSHSVRRSMAALLPAFAFAAAGCLTTPNNHQQICGANASVSFTGYLPWPNHGVVFQVATSPTGPWTQFGNATSSGTGFNYAGFTLYSFSKALPIPTWTSAGGALHAYVRARTNAGQQPGDQLWKELTTFEINPPVGGNAVGCIGNRVNNGATLNEALTYCASSSSPVVDITAPFASTCGCSNTVYNGDLVIDSAAAAAQYVCLQTLNGSLTVTEGAPEVLPLASLQTITGNATLSYSYPFLMGTIAYRSRTIDLPALTSIGGTLSITAKRSDGSSLSYPFSMNAVTSVGGNILIDVYGLNPSGLAGLTSHTGNLTITGHNLDVNAGNLLTGLTHVTGDILVENIYATNNVLNSLQTLTGNVTLKKLLSHNNFLGLQSVSGNLRFEYMQLFGATWASLTSVGGELAVIGGPSGFTSLQLLPVGATTAGSFRLETQPVMTTLAGSSFHVVGAGPITISGAPVLSQCEVNTFLDAQQAAGWTGTPDVSGTIPCP